MFIGKKEVLATKISKAEVLEIIRANMLVMKPFSMPPLDKGTPFYGTIKEDSFYIKMVNGSTVAEVKGKVITTANGSEIKLIFKPFYIILIAAILVAMFFLYSAYKSYLGDGERITSDLISAIIPFLFFGGVSYLFNKRRVSTTTSTFKDLLKS